MAPLRNDSAGTLEATLRGSWTMLDQLKAVGVACPHCPRHTPQGARVTLRREEEVSLLVEPPLRGKGSFKCRSPTRVASFAAAPSSI